jgi:hypothetical protein
MAEQTGKERGGSMIREMMSDLRSEYDRREREAYERGKTEMLRECIGLVRAHCDKACSTDDLLAYLEGLL